MGAIVELQHERVGSRDLEASDSVNRVSMCVFSTYRNGSIFSGGRPECKRVSILDSASRVVVS